MRTLHLTSPLTSGSDVRVLQRDVNLHLKRWGANTGFLDEDGQYGPLSEHRAREVAFGIGLGQGTYQHGVTPYVRHRIHDLRLLNPVQRKRLHERRSWRVRFAHRLHGGGVQLATAYAKRMAALGVHEVPAGSNAGPFITEWERLTGYGPGVYWCGCFINAVLIAGGFHPQPFLGYVPNVEAKARGGRDGWSWHGAGAQREGDLACFGGGEHIEYVTATGSPLRTIGGNTSKGDGSPNNGGGVFAHDFSRYQGLRLDGYARPPWR